MDYDLEFIIVYYFEIIWSFICMSNCVTYSAILIFESDLNYLFGSFNMLKEI